MEITLYSILSRFIGMREVPGAVANPAILAMLKLDNDWPQDDGVSWCGAFIGYGAWLLDLPHSKSLMARSWLRVGTPIDLEDAVRGYDVVVLSRDEAGPTAGHVGLFAGYLPAENKVLLLSGNVSDAVTISAFDAARALGVRRLA